MSRPPQNDGERVSWVAVYAAAWVSMRSKLGEVEAHGVTSKLADLDVAELAATEADLALDQLRILAGFKESSTYAVIGDPDADG